MKNKPKIIILAILWGIIAGLTPFLIDQYLEIRKDNEQLNQELAGAIGTLTTKQKLATALIETGFDKMGTTTPFTTSYYKSHTTEYIYECLLHNIRLLKNPITEGVTYTVNCR